MHIIFYLLNIHVQLEIMHSLTSQYIRPSIVLHGLQAKNTWKTYRCNFALDCMNRFRWCKTGRGRCCRARRSSEVGRRVEWDREKGCYKPRMGRRRTRTRPGGRERPAEELHTKVGSSSFLHVYLSLVLCRIEVFHKEPWSLSIVFIRKCIAFVLKQR